MTVVKLLLILAVLIALWISIYNIPTVDRKKKFLLVYDKKICFFVSLHYLELFILKNANKFQSYEIYIQYLDKYVFLTDKLEM